MDPENQKVRIIICTGGAWESIHGVLRYRPIGLPKRILQLPLNSTYSELLTCVARKLNASLQSGFSFRMTYQFPLSSSNQNKTVVVDIADDVDVFVDLALKTSNGLVTLYVVESVSSRPGQSDAEKDEGKHVFTYQHLFPEHKTAHTAGTSENDPAQNFESGDDHGDERDLVRDQKASSYGAKVVNPLMHSGTLDLDGDEDTSWLMPLSRSTPASNITSRKSVPEKEAGGRVGKGISWWMNSSSSPSASDLTLKPPVSCMAEKDAFWSMPDLSLPELGSSSDPKTPKLFNNKEASKLALKMKCVEEGFKMKTTRSTKERYEVRCVSDACDTVHNSTTAQPPGPVPNRPKRNLKLSARFMD